MLGFVWMLKSFLLLFVALLGQHSSSWWIQGAVELFFASSWNPPSWRAPRDIFRDVRSKKELGGENCPLELVTAVGFSYCLCYLNFPSKAPLDRTYYVTITHLLLLLISLVQQMAYIIIQVRLLFVAYMPSDGNVTTDKWCLSWGSKTFGFRIDSIVCWFSSLRKFGETIQNRSKSNRKPYENQFKSHPKPNQK